MMMNDDDRLTGDDAIIIIIHCSAYRMLCDILANNQSIFNYL